VKPLFKKSAVKSLTAIVALSVIAPFVAAQSGEAPAAQARTASAISLDFEFFKTRVEPIFLKKRPRHARCYACHAGNNSGPTYLETLLPGTTFWTEDQSHKNFKNVSRLVVPGNPSASRLLTHPLAPEAGGDIPNPLVHQGGRQFASKDDPDWQTIAQWVAGGVKPSGVAEGVNEQGRKPTDTNWKEDSSGP
jgi:hypothetical protein